MQSPTPPLEERIAAIADDVEAAGDGVARGIAPGLDRMRARARAEDICREIVETPPELARSCVPALETLLARLDVLARRVEDERDRLTDRLASLDPGSGPST